MKKEHCTVIANTSVVLACNLKSSPLLDVLTGQNDATSTVAGHEDDHENGRGGGVPPSMPAVGDKNILRQAHLKATISHFNDLSAQYDHYALKRLEYLEQIDRIILEQIGKHPRCSYLDVGCGTGRLLEKIHQAFPESRGSGIDICPKMVEICHSKGLDVTQADFFSYQPAAPFDVVFLEFNVFGYLIVQNGLTDTIRHLRRLAGDRGCIIFDILNPFCLTYSRLRQSMPTAIRRCCNLLARRGECHFSYSVGGNPINMGLAWPGKVEGQFMDTGYTVQRLLVKYADHRWLRPMPRLLSSQFLFVASRQ